MVYNQLVEMQVRSEQGVLQVSSQKMDSLEAQLNLFSKAYLDEIKMLKEVLKQKSVKQTVLKTQIQTLKIQCKTHAEQVLAMLQKRVSPVKSHKSNKSDAEISICLQQSSKHQKSQQHISTNSIPLLIPTHHRNQQINSPRYKLKQTTSVSNPEQISTKGLNPVTMRMATAVARDGSIGENCVNTKQAERGMGPNGMSIGQQCMGTGQTKAKSPSNIIQLKQTSFCQNSNRYSYEFEGGRENRSKVRQKELVKSIGFRSINAEDKSHQAKQNL